MKLLLAGGGTAGHINPALAIAGYACQREPATQILYVGARAAWRSVWSPRRAMISSGSRFQAFKENCPLKT